METKRKIHSSAVLFAAILMLSSCSLLDSREFYDQMDTRFDQAMFRPAEDFQVVPGDRGHYMDESEMMGRVPATSSMNESSRYDSSIARELYSLEAQLNEEDYEVYSQVRGQLGSDYERIYYLRLHPAEKHQYLSARGIAPKRYYSAQEAVRGPVANISLGMGKSDVLSYWGEPDRRDYAGNPQLGNERWAYNRNGRVKYVYFESGQVEGWAEQ